MELYSRVEFLNESLDKFFNDVHEGNYNCSSKGLTSLVDLDIPSTINGYFNCGDNKLTSLEGCPQEVKGDFYCGDNKKLTSLEGCPQVVNGYFNCGYNNLTSLDFLPEISGDLYIKSCPRITKEMIEEVKRSGKVKGEIISSYGTKK